MRILDRYLLKQFLQVFVICFLSFIGLFIVIDAFQHLDQFLDVAERQGSLLTVMGQYYAYRALDLFDRTSGMLALIAAMFAITWLQRHNEMTALEAAGIPKLRIVKPILLAALSISLVAAANRELVMPNCRVQLARDARDLSGTKQHPVVPCMDHETEIFLRGDQLTVADQQISRPNFLLPSSLSSYGTKITAATATFKPSQAEHPSGYLLSRVTSPTKIAARTSLALDGRTVIFMPQDADWLADDECFVASNVEFQMLTGGDAGRRYASTLEMIRGLHNPSNNFAADRRVAVHSRVLQPLMDATLLLLGIPIVLSRNDRNVFLAIGLCVGVVVVFMITTITCQYLGNTSLISAALASWLPLIIFVPIAVALADPFRRHTSSRQETRNATVPT